ncbi:MAG: bluetail domain-containing putative surface protein [Dolichospermum sp.]
MANNFNWIDATTLNGTLWDNGTLSSATPITQIGTLTISDYYQKYLNTQLNNTGTIIENDSRLYFHDGLIMQRLFNFTQSDRFWANWQRAFGTNYDVIKATELRQQWRSRDFSQLRFIEVLNGDVLGTANGAYASSNNKIYLSASFLNTASPESIVNVILEEIGHYVDAQINQVDTVGDEGEYFSALVRGVDLTAQELKRIATENDFANITIAGNDIPVEKSAPIILTVNTTADQNDGSATNGLSLRDAILIANANTTNDYIIELQGGQTYFLTQGNNSPLILDDENAAKTGDIDILAGGNITIKSVGNGSAIIDGSQVLSPFRVGDRVLHVLDGGNLTLDNITITKAKLGGVWIDKNGMANINNSTITENTSDRFIGGSKSQGAGIINFGTLNLTNSNITKNATDRDAGGIGNFGTANLTNSLIDNNSSANNGAGIYNEGSLTLTNTIVSNNSIINKISSYAVTGEGGGIYNSDTGSITLINSTINQNISEFNGGGISNQGTVLINNSIISNNTSNYTGGGIFIDTVLAIAPANAYQSEGDNGSKAFTFTINRTGYLLSAVSVDYTVEGVVLIAVVDGWESASADDFTGGVFPSGTVSFVPGETSKVIRVNVQGDTTPEVEGDFPSQDVFTVTLSNPTNGATITTANAFGTIQNDDTSVSLAVSPPSVTEDGTTNLVYTFTRTGVTSNALTVNYKVGGTATIGTDYTGIATVGTTKTVTFAAGASTATVTVNPTVDATVESDETVVLTLASGTGYTIGTTNAVTGTITNDDPFTGTSNADTLIGTNGADTLIGLAGNDTYTVNHIGDIVTEALNAGTDLVNSSISYTLPNNVENLTLTGTTNLNGTGNSLNNTLTGNSGNNTLTGNAGNDTLNGGSGIDTLIGGSGNDTYQINTPTDTITENPGEGTDSIQSSVTFDLTVFPNIENLTLTGTDAINGTGNAGNNSLTGNSGNNTLNGGAGADTLRGGVGSDIFVFQFGQSPVSGADRITDFAIGTDKIDLLTSLGVAMNAPTSFTRAANSTATTLTNVVNNVFTDANGVLTGNQALGVNSAALVSVTTSGITGTYLVINDGVAGFQSRNDLLVNITGYSGTLPALGTIAVSSLFI